MSEPAGAVSEEEVGCCSSRYCARTRCTWLGLGLGLGVGVRVGVEGRSQGEIRCTSSARAACRAAVGLSAGRLPPSAPVAPG